MKCSLVEAFHWSLHDIDVTDIESLIPFVFLYPQWKQARRFGGNGPQQVYADQVEL